MKKFIFLLFLFGCGAIEPKSAKIVLLTPPSVPKELAYIVATYLEEAKNYGLDNTTYYAITEIKWGNAEAIAKQVGVVGVCEPGYERVDDSEGGYWKRRITIDERLKDYRVLKAVVYHELGHCVHNAQHSADDENIMYPLVSSKFVASEGRWAYYKNKMFDYIKNGGQTYGSLTYCLDNQGDL